MAISNGVWEIRDTGNSLNGGCFNLASGGTDYSQQDAAQLSIGDAAATGTTTLTSVTGGFTAAMVGNVLQISGGTLTAGFYEITGFTNTSTITLDRPPGTGSGSTAKVGGALTSLQAAITGAVAASATGSTFWVRYAATPYTLSNATMSPPSWASPNPTVINGYYATRGDLEGTNSFANCPIIKKAAGNEPIFTLTGTAQRIRCMILDGNSLSTFGISIAGATSPVCEFVKATGCTTSGFLVTGMACVRCLASGNAVGFQSSTAAGTMISGCTATANTSHGINTGGGTTVHDCLIYANGGSGINNSSGAINILGCTIYSNTSDGVRMGNISQVHGTQVRNTILTNNGGYGVNLATGTGPSSWAGSNFNAFGGGASANTSGARNGLPAGANDVTLAGDPYTNAAGGDFTLNTSAGAACRNAGFPGVLPGTSGMGYGDIGALRHQDPAASGVGLPVIGSAIVRARRSA